MLRPVILSAALMLASATHAHAQMAQPPVVLCTQQVPGNEGTNGFGPSAESGNVRAFPTCRFDVIRRAPEGPGDATVTYGVDWPATPGNDRPAILIMNDQGPAYEELDNGLRPFLMPVDPCLRRPDACADTSPYDLMIPGEGVSSGGGGIFGRTFMPGDGVSTGGGRPGDGVGSGGGIIGNRIFPADGVSSGGGVISPGHAASLIGG
jgi:hypothetical protein